MDLGAFSISLAVKDLQASKAFYEKLGFAVFGGDADHNWLIMKNGSISPACSRACSTRTSCPQPWLGSEHDRNKDLH